MFESKDFKKEKEKIAKKINKCFDKEIRTQTFVVNGITADVDGETRFYKKSDIDKAVKKLNKVINWLEK